MDSHQHDLIALSAVGVGVFKQSVFCIKSVFGGCTVVRTGDVVYLTSELISKTASHSRIYKSGCIEALSLRRQVPNTVVSESIFEAEIKLKTRTRNGVCCVFHQF